MNESRESVLNRIKRLYTKLFLVSLHNRIDSYHASSNTDHHNRISDSLDKLIDKTSEEASRTHSVRVDKNVQPPHRDSSTEVKKSNKLQDHETSMLSMTLNGLSVYFRKQKTIEHDPQMSEKLKKCVWDHVHSAHRFARTGDANTARLHAGIATNAMKALSQYMPEEEYSDFYTEVHSQLDEGAGKKTKPTE